MDSTQGNQRTLIGRYWTYYGLAESDLYHLAFESLTAVNILVFPHPLPVRSPAQHISRSFKIAAKAGFVAGWNGGEDGPRRGRQGIASSGYVSTRIPAVALTSPSQQNGLASFADWAQTATQREFAEASPAARPQDLGVLIYTSGTTGVPKAVPLTHGAFMILCYAPSRCPAPPHAK